MVCLASAGLFFTACTDDSGSTNQQCGNGLVEGTEQCDGTELGGAACTTIAGDFSGGALACTDDCTFDTSQCGDFFCGDGLVEAGEECDNANLNGEDCTTILGGFTGGTLACTTGCTYDTALCVTEGDSGIANARATPDGAGLSLPIVGSYVTYIKPVLGAEVAGFFIQALPTGPALFIAVDPATLTPSAPVQGDEVSFTITEMGTRIGLRQALAISNFSVDSQGFNVATLIQYVSSASDLVSDLDRYSSELMSIDATLITNFADAGFPGRAADIATAGYPGGDAGLQLRVPDTVETALDLSNGCSITVVGTPLWRSDGTAQLAAWNAGEVTINSCPAPTVVGATATDGTTVVVTFDRQIDPTTVTAGDFTFNLGLTAVSIVSVVGSLVTVETVTQTAQAAYVVTANTLTDTLGSAIDTNRNTANFVGVGAAEVSCTDNLDDNNDGTIDCFDSSCAADAACLWGGQLYIWEVDVDQTGTDTEEFIEIWNNTGVAVDFDTGNPYYLIFVDGTDDFAYDATRLSGTVASGDVFVVGNSAVANVDQLLPNGILEQGADGIIIAQCSDATCGTGAAEFPDNTVIGTAAQLTGAAGGTFNRIDAMVYETNDQDDPGLQAVCLVSAQFDESAGTGGASQNSLHRTSLANFLSLPPTPGVPTP